MLKLSFHLYLVSCSVDNMSKLKCCLFLYFFLGLCLSAEGITSNLPGAYRRIINGHTESQLSEYAVFVEVNSQGTLFTRGGGTLVSPNVVVTAAQLILGYDEFIVNFGHLIWENMFRVYVEEAAAHPKYDKKNQKHNIGFLRLAVSVDVSELVLG